MCYVQSTLGRSQYAWIGDLANDYEVALFADADFAGDPTTNKSTSGVHLCLAGPSTNFPLKVNPRDKQAVGNSKPEAEIAAAAYAIRQYGLPLLDLIQQI